MQILEAGGMGVDKPFPNTLQEAWSLVAGGEKSWRF